MNDKRLQEEAKRLIDLARGDDPPGDDDKNVQEVVQIILEMGDTASKVATTAGARLWLEGLLAIVAIQRRM